ncbi:MAG: hypothetical protein KDD41_10400 [Flavobacteriales bacterium]|nr:hypothetical protein [Flavobacteriales bacterium]
MVKSTLYITAFIFLIGCQPTSEEFANEPDHTTLPGDNPTEEQEPDFDLNGTWGLTNYFDTILKHKELAKYRVQPATWFAILLEIEGDSLRHFGSIENKAHTIERGRDTILTLVSQIGGGRWNLIVNEPYLTLAQNPEGEQVDPTVYVFRKRNDLSAFTKENPDFFIIGHNVTNYFNDELFQGTYMNPATRQEVVFGAGGQLTGIEGFDTYEVRNYFGTLHMHKNLDVITFNNRKNKAYKQYHWVFSGNELILTEFVYEKITDNGVTYEGDHLIPGKEKLILKKR